MAALAGLVLALLVPTARASDITGVVAETPSDASVQFVDGEVRSIAQVGNSIVTGGTFTQVGPGRRGAAGVVDIAGAAFTGAIPDVDGVVRDAVIDGAGGWYVGGTFTTIGGVARANLAHVDAGGTITTWDPDPNGTVYSLARGGSGVYVGGDFTSLGASAVTNLGLVSDVDASLTWGGVAKGGEVRALALDADESTLYLGGDFRRVGGVQMYRLAAVDATTGALDTSFVPGKVNMAVNAISVVGTDVYFGGRFTKVNGVFRKRVARVDAASGVLGAFDPAMNGTVGDISLSPDGATMYAVGTFSKAGGVPHNGVASVATATGSVTGLDVANLTGSVNAVAATNDGAYIGGDFRIDPRKQMPAVLAKIDTGGNASQVVPHAAQPMSLAREPVESFGVNTLVIDGAGLFVGGDFSDHGIIDRPYLVAIDVATGALDLDFDPQPNKAINAVEAATDASSVFVGGPVTKFAGEWHVRLAKLDIATGAPIAGVDTNVGSVVNAIAADPDGSTVYIGGAFGTVNGAAASRLAAVDTAGGDLVPGFDIPVENATGRSPDGSVRSIEVSSDGSRLMALYNASTLGGQYRQGIGQIDLTTSPASVTDWQPWDDHNNRQYYDYECKSSVSRPLMRDLAIAPDDSYVVVVTSGDWRPPGCDAVVAFPMSAPAGGHAVPLWWQEPGDTLETVAVTSDAVYIGGHFQWLDRSTKADPRFQIGALDPNNLVDDPNSPYPWKKPAAHSWDPSVNGLRGALALEVTDIGLVMGSDGTSVRGTPHGRFAVFEPTQ